MLLKPAGIGTQIGGTQRLVHGITINVSMHFANVEQH